MNKSARKHYFNLELSLFSKNMQDSLGSPNRRAV